MTESHSEMHAQTGKHSTDSVKQIRRIGGRTAMPTEKAQLIQYLSDRIQQAEDALNDTEELLDTEVIEREKISKAISDRNHQLEKLFEVDQRGLPEKIREKLTEILTTTVQQKMEAEEALQAEKARNHQYTQRFRQLRWEEDRYNQKLEEQRKKEEELSHTLKILDAENTQHEIDIQEKEQQLEEVRSKKDKTENSYLQFKVALERMTEIRAVLNRFFGNQDLFDEKMTLKQQRVHKVEVVLKEKQPILPSRQGKNHTKLKPLVHPAKGGDDDFWRGELPRHNRLQS